MYSDPNGDIKVKLEITDYAAGDNYVVTAAAMNPPDATEDATGKMVAWKRVYLEIDRMFVYGHDITSISDPSTWPGYDLLHSASAGANRLYVQRPEPFGQGDTVRVFDSANCGGECRQVTETGSDLDGAYLELSSPLEDSYSAGYSGGQRAAAVIKVGTSVYSQDVMSRLQEAYGEITLPTGCSPAAGCFVDFAETPTGQNELPFRSGYSSWQERSIFSGPWFHNSNLPNVVHVLVVFSLAGGEKGWSSDSGNWSYVSWQQALNGSEDDDMAASLADEIAHQFSVDDSDSLHPDVLSWPLRAGWYCLMDTHEIGYECDQPCYFCREGPDHVHQIRHAGDPL